MKDFYYMKLYKLPFNKKIYYGIVCIEKIIPIFIGNLENDRILEKVISGIYDIYDNIVKDEYEIIELKKKCKSIIEWMDDNARDEDYLEDIPTEQNELFNAWFNFCNFLITEDNKYMDYLKYTLVATQEIVSIISQYYDKDPDIEHEWQKEVLDIVYSCKDFWPNEKIEKLKEFFWKKYYFFKDDIIFETKNIRNYKIRDNDIALKDTIIDNKIYNDMKIITEFFEMEFDDIPPTFNMLCETVVNNSNCIFKGYVNIQFYDCGITEVNIRILYEEKIMELIQKELNSFVNRVFVVGVADFEMYENKRKLQIKNDKLTVTLMKEYYV